MAENTLLKHFGNRYLQEVAKTVGQLYLLSETLIAKRKIVLTGGFLQRTILMDLERKAVDKNENFQCFIYSTCQNKKEGF